MAATAEAAGLAAPPAAEWFAWAPAVSASTASALKAAPVACLTYLLVSPLKVCADIKKAGTVGSLSPASFVAVANASAVWFTFGALLQDPVIMLPNVAGLVLSVHYWRTYARYSEAGSLTRWAAGSAALSGSVAAAAALGPASVVTPVVGNVAAALSLWLSVSPLAGLRTVMRERTAASLPLPICVGVVLNNVSWVSYGLLVAKNPYLVFPNSVGLAAGLLQLSMFAVYGRGPPSRKTDAAKEA
jgi:solute carrier family 50 protein (sugar transporter)